MTRLILLPGLDGSGALFSAFCSCLPAGVQAEPITLPSTESSYHTLAATLLPQLRLDSNTVLLAESFSGPLAVLLASAARIRGLILCNSFVSSPWPQLLGTLVRPLLGLTPPRFLVRALLTGHDASNEVVDRFREVVDAVPSRILASRVESALRADVGALLSNHAGPLIYLRGTGDRLVPQSSVASLLRSAPGTTVIRIPGPHLLLQAHPEQAWTALEPHVSAMAAA